MGIERRGTRDLVVIIISFIEVEIQVVLEREVSGGSSIVGVQHIRKNV